MKIKLLVYFLILANVAFAQEGEAGFFLGLEKISEEQYEEMKKELILNNKQLDSIKKFDLDAINQRTAIETAEGDSMFDEIKKVSKGKKERIKTVLTLEQFEKYLDYQFVIYGEQFKQYLIRRHSHLNLKFSN